MKVVAVALFAAAITSAFAQITAEEKSILSGFTSLRAEKEIMLELDGTDKFGAKTSVLYSNAFFNWDPLKPDSFAKVEVNDYLNGNHTHRIVGDGTTLWGYDFTKNAYTSFRYGAYSGTLAPDFRANMLQELTTNSRGTTVFMSRMLREVFSGDIAQYRTWFPGAQITLLTKTSSPPVMTDPVDQNRSYVADDLNLYVIYTYTPRTQRSSAFHFSRPDLNSPWSLSEIYYADSQTAGSSVVRFVDWRITVHTGVLPLSTNYVFVPPTNARAIANVKGQGG
jgi:hypothetical protein